MKLYYIRFWLVLAIIPAFALLIIQGFVQDQMSVKDWFRIESKEFRRFVTKMWQTGDGHP